MSALFDDAQRFEAHIVVGDTIRHVKDSTNVHVGPGTYRYVMRLRGKSQRGLACNPDHVCVDMCLDDQ